MLNSLIWCISRVTLAGITSSFPAIKLYLVHDTVITWQKSKSPTL
ncbi:hypothetical protein [Marinagarivorans cellulosilyticus]|nr:hypothetical protein [Marinagarivorans cellulosilyticus]